MSTFKLMPPIFTTADTPDNAAAPGRTGAGWRAGATAQSIPLSARASAKLRLLRMGITQRLLGLGLVLMAMAVLTGVSLTQAGLLEQSADALETQVLPGLRQGHELRRMVDETRGMEAMLLLAPDRAAREQLVGQLQQQRLRVMAQWAAQQRRAAASAHYSVADQALFEAVAARLTAYWAAQDEVRAALEAADSATVIVAAQGLSPAVEQTSPHYGLQATAAFASPSAGNAQPLSPQQRARRLLAGPSQAAWRAVAESLEMWLQGQEQRAAQLAEQSRGQAVWWRSGLAAMLASICLISAGLLVRLRQKAEEHGPPSTLPGLPEAMDRIATHSRMVALNAAVQAARSGQPGAADQAERAHLASQAEALARQCDAARQGLRLGQPKARRRVSPQPGVGDAAVPTSAAPAAGAPALSDAHDPK